MKNIVIISVLNRDVLFLLKFKCEETDQSPFYNFLLHLPLKKYMQLACKAREEIFP